MEKISDNPTVMRLASGIWIVKISDVGDEFANWLIGKPLPIVVEILIENETPTSWAYYGDYSRFVNKQLVID